MNKNNTINTIKWTATAVTLAGAILASLNIYPACAVVLNLGSFLFLIWSVLIRDPAMITVNAGLLSIYTVGLAIKLL
jgi:hypothetical protein